MSRVRSLVARESELDRALASLQFSGGVLIAGEAGVGKTLLAAAVAERLPQPPVASVVATTASQSTPLGALAGLLPADLTTIHPALVAQHVSTRLRSLGRADSRSNAAPVLVVDDAQLLDAQSAAVLLSLVTAKSLRLLATMRVGGTPSDAVTALWKEELVDRLDLEPLGRAGSRRLLEAELDGAVSSGTAEMLWRSSGGNPLYLSELARFGAAHHHLERAAGVWWWVGGNEMPPRLGELLRRRIDALSERGRDAAEVLALGEPLPYETLAAVVSDDAILELDRAQIISSDADDGRLLVRFAHPLLQAVAERGLSATRRRALARRLCSAPAENVDIVRRATWEDAGGLAPNVDRLLAAADAVLLNDSAAAERLAARAHQVEPGVRTAVGLAAAQAESGRPGEARATLEAARPLIRSGDDELAFVAEDLSLALWGERDPDQAVAIVDRLRADRADARAGVLGAEAVIALFTGGCAAAIPPAQAVLVSDAGPSARIRALTCLTGALAFADRGAEAIAAGQQLLDALAETRVSATRAGLGYALAALTGVFYGVEYRLPRPIGLSGRWPGEPAQLNGTAVRPTDVTDAGPAGELGWPLLVGLRRHFRGDLEGAVAPLREAYVQQQAGQGLFRSEATAELVVVLAELGQVDEATTIMRDHPPDGVAIIPGLASWAWSAVEAAGGHHRRAAELALEAARTAAARGCATMAMNFLTDAGRFGDPQAAAKALPELGLALDTDLQRVRALDISARAAGRPDLLVIAAETQLAAGFNRHATELATLAVETDTQRAYARQSAAVLRQARDQLGHPPASATRRSGLLTERETEVSRLASLGLTDRDIADELVLSVRTVQSHLASSYRKLGITSRAQLAEARP